MIGGPTFVGVSAISGKNPLSVALTSKRVDALGDVVPIPVCAYVRKEMQKILQPQKIYFPFDD